MANNQIASDFDWRRNLFGSFIQENPTAATNQDDEDEETPTTLVPTQEAFNDKLYDYIAVFIGANYCPHCRDFAPTVVASVPYLDDKKCKVVFVSNDRDETNFNISCKKIAGVDVMPYDLTKTKAMRDLFGLKTIPALMILRNNDFAASQPTIVTNARHILLGDPKAEDFPWPDGDTDMDEKNKKKTSSTEPTSSGQISTMDRFIIRGKYGKWWELGHHSNPDKPEEMYMDEHAVRARAGILNTITWIALMNVFFFRDQIFVKILFPLVAWEMLISMTIGLTPLAPLGVAGTILAVALHPEPLWKPAKPKRFAWAIGLSLATLCLTFFLLRNSLGQAYRPLVGWTVLTCNLATWFESSCGFCFGCFIYNTYLVKWFDLEECQECKI